MLFSTFLFPLSKTLSKMTPLLQLKFAAQHLFIETLFHVTLVAIFEKNVLNCVWKLEIISPTVWDDFLWFWYLLGLTLLAGMGSVQWSFIEYQTRDSASNSNFHHWPCLPACDASVALEWLNRFYFCLPIVRSWEVSDQWSLDK